jgi:hypothetical protein
VSCVGDVFDVGNVIPCLLYYELFGERTDSSRALYEAGGRAR